MINNLFDLRAEQYIIGYMLLNDDIAERCAVILTEHDFTDPFLLDVFKAIVEVRKRDRRCAAVMEAVFRQFQRSPPKETHWVVKLGKLITDFEHLKGSTSYLSLYLRELRAATRRRAVQWAAGQVEGAANFEDPVARLREVVDEVAARSPDTDTPPLIGADVLNTLDAIDREARDGSSLIGSGFAWIDEFTGGLARGEVTVVAAGPGQGKTTLAVCSAIHNAKCGRSVVYVSLEMAAVELHKRMLAHLAGVNLSKLSGGQFKQYSDQQRKTLVASANAMSQWKLKIIDSADLTVAHIGNVLSHHRRDHGLDLIVIDYLGLVTPDNKKVSRNEQVGQISRDIKLLARDMDAPVLSLSQFNREGVKGDPKLHHLRDSGSIEADADSVWLIWGDEGDRRDRATIKIHIAKNRRGPTVITSAIFDKPWQRILPPDYDEPTTF